MSERWFPKQDDTYYYPVTDMGVADFGRAVYEVNNLTNLLHFRHLMCFPNKHEAIVAARRMLQALHGPEMSCSRVGVMYDCQSCCSSFKLPEGVNIRYCPICEAPIKN